MSGPEAGAPPLEEPTRPKVMINLRFTLEDGTAEMVYDVFPECQQAPVEIPSEAVAVSVWLGVR